jgi:hypothetical protein
MRMKVHWWWRAATLTIATGIVALLATQWSGHRYRLYLNHDVRLCRSALQFLTASTRSAIVDAVEGPLAVDGGTRTTLRYRIRNVFAGELQGTIDCHLGPVSPDRPGRLHDLRIDGEAVDEAMLEELNRVLADAD